MNQGHTTLCLLTTQACDLLEPRALRADVDAHVGSQARMTGSIQAWAKGPKLAEV